MLVHPIYESLFLGKAYEQTQDIIALVYASIFCFCQDGKIGPKCNTLINTGSQRYTYN